MSLLTELASRIKTRVQNHSITLSQIADGLITGVKLLNNTITFSKIQQIGAYKLLGNVTGLTANISAVPMTIIPLVTTFADCENTTDEVDIITATIPAGTLRVGDVVVIPVQITRLQNSGASITLTEGVKRPAGTKTVTHTTSVATSSSLFRILQNLTFVVESIISNTVTFSAPASTSGTAAVTLTSSPALGATTVSNGAQSAGSKSYQTFTSNYNSDYNVKISAQWASANANAWIRVQQAQAYIIKKAV